MFPAHIELHFDGKIRRQNREKFDFLALCVTGEGMEKEKLLGDIPMPTGSGHNMSLAANSMLEEWHIESDAVIALSFDTTSSNTGATNGESIVTEVKWYSIETM